MDLSTVKCSASVICHPMSVFPVARKEVISAEVVVVVVEEEIKEEVRFLHKIAVPLRNFSAGLSK
jgi:hypothetical protein